jgi:hypothetical protein
MKSNKEPSSKPQAPPATFTSVGYSPITFNAAIVASVIETEFSTPITQASLQSP